MVEELARYQCSSDDGTYLTVLEYRYVHIVRRDGKVRRQLGAARLALTDGEPIRHVDRQTFEIVRSGELLRRLC